MKKILVIDDEPHILLMVSHRLKANGYEVTTALSGSEGLDEIGRMTPDLVLLDQIMPGLNGEEVLERLKKASATRDIPVVIFTADVKPARVEQYRKLGAADCIYKPFTADDLLDSIQKILGGKT